MDERSGVRFVGTAASAAPSNQEQEEQFNDWEQLLPSGDNAHDVMDNFDGIDRGLSLEDASSQEKEPFGKWRDVKAGKEARATVGFAVGQAWVQAKKEFEHIRGKMQVKCGTFRLKLQPIFDLFLGENSELYRVFQDEKVFDSHSDFLKFVATFYLSCAYQVPCKQLFDKCSCVDTTGAMKKEDYLKAWHRIGTACLPSREERNRRATPTGMVPLWMKVETAINNFCQELFLSGFPGMMQCTLEDDKAHVPGTEYTAGLKPMRHQKDNVIGHTLHTLVFSFSQTLVQITWKRQVNDSSQTATERVFSNGITPMAAQGEPGDLRAVSTSMDRGYWLHKLLHDYFMKGGAKILTLTVKRQKCIPMTHKDKLMPNDKREEIPCQGPKTLFTKVTTIHGRKLYNHAYRHGHGGVTLGISTEHGAVPEWEFAPLNPRDLQWYECVAQLSTAEKLNKGFRLLKMKFDSNRYRESLFEDGLGVRPLTTCQGSPEWFFLCRFSLISSTTDKSINSCSGNEEWLSQKPSWKKVKDVLEGIGLVDDNSGATDDFESDESGDDGGAEASVSGPETASTAAAPIKLSLDALLESEGLITMARQQVQLNECNITEIRDVLTALGKPLSKAKADTKKAENDVASFQVFLDAEPRLCKHAFKSKKVMQSIATKLQCDPHPWCSELAFVWLFVVGP